MSVTPGYLDAPEPAGFGNCGTCPYRETGPVHICYECARKTLSPPGLACCPICGQQLREGSSCSNSLCVAPSQRFFESVAAIAMKTGPLQTAIWHMKYQGKWGWGLIFARVMLGYLYEHPAVVNQLDAIIPMPAYVEAGADPHSDHARFVIEQAAAQDETQRPLPFVYDPPLIVKTSATPKMQATGSAAERRAAADQLYRALYVPDPTRVAGQNIMIYDDVLTGGNTLNAVARRLRDDGATTVTGLILGRQPWQSS